MKYTLRGYRAEVPEDQKGAAGEPIDFIASTEGVKRDGMDLSLSQWDLTNFKRNPVFLWSHDYMGRNLPIGRVQITPDKEANVLKARVWFDQNDPFAVQVEDKYRNNFLNAVSVGWNTILPDGKMMHEVTKDQIRLDLLDLSGVPVPGDADALMLRFIESLDEDENPLLALLKRELTPDSTTTRVQPPHRTDLTPVNQRWLPSEDLPTNNTASEQLKRAAAWVDTDLHPSQRSAYRFLHHLRTGEVVWYGVAASMAELFTDITTGVPDGDRKGVYTHLARHYQQFGKEPPEYLERGYLGALSGEEIRGLFSEGEPDLYPEMFSSAGKRKGAVLSSRNLSELDQAIALLSGIRSRAAAAEEELPEPEFDTETLRLLTEVHTRFAGVTT